MSISDKVTTLSDELDQRQKAQQARAILQNFRSVVIETNSQLQAIADTGSLNTIDNEIKDILVAGWNISKAAEVALEDASLVELLDWRP